MSKRAWPLLFILALPFAHSSDVRMCAQTAQPDLTSVFKGTEAAFVLYDLKNERYIRYNEERCRTRFSPFSTFKIPNSVIGLETGVIHDAEFVIPWDSKKYPSQSDWNVEPFDHWAQDHTLRSAIKYSVVWYYRELAKRVGEDRMQKYLTEFNYGNHDISGGIYGNGLYNAFWLGSSLKISADEQVEFLKKFYSGKLPVAKRSIDIVKEILVLERTPQYTLGGKIGGGSENGRTRGWFVGYLETHGNVYLFALNLDGANFAEIAPKRIALTKRALAVLGFIQE
ncbi:MAG TPA: penicillin-binding transpeptidase domain-containing protein [Blastocatellia bacterium]|nr:penicillin-binding transpeptidase domain-containing protein [Blastocatellia bacterium]